MASIRELAQLIGAHGRWTVNGLSVPVMILDAREVFGRVDLLISPVGGKGEVWADRVNVSTAGTEGGKKVAK